MPHFPHMKLLYIADPMCSWCWGFSPVIAAIAERYSDRVPVELIMGGLRAGNTVPMDQAAKDTIRHHWEQVHDASGQPFDYEFFERDDFVYDTEPACRAVVTVRNLAAESTLLYLARVHRAFYSENRDVTTLEPLAEAVAAVDVDVTTFRMEVETEQMRSAAAADFQLAARMGVRGFPTLIGHDGDRLTLLTSGYRPLSDLAPLLDRWLEQHGA